MSMTESDIPREIKIGNIYGFDGGNFAGNVYDADGICPCLRTFCGGNQQPMVKKNNGTGTSTMEPICMNSKVDGKQPSLSNRVYDSNGIACACTKSNFFMPNYTVTAGSNGLCRIEPVIAASRGRNPSDPSERMVRTEEGKALRKKYEAHEIRHGYNEYRKAEPREDGVSNSLTSVQKDNLLLEPQIRIRKLTPKECWRLMGFSDGDFERAEKVNSNSQLYKQAGNSIVVDVLMEIFKEMI